MFTFTSATCYFQKRFAEEISCQNTATSAALSGHLGQRSDVEHYLPV